MEQQQKDTDVGASLPPREQSSLPETESHTPGPWSCNVKSGYVYGKDVVVARIGALDADGRKMMADTSGKRWAADAHLIASAPELYEALQRVCDALRDTEYGDPLSHIGWSDPEACDAWTQGQAALANANR